MNNSKLVNTVNGGLKGGRAYCDTHGKNYKIDYDAYISRNVNVVDKRTGQSVLVAHQPYGEGNVEHLKINPQTPGKASRRVNLPKGGVRVRLLV